MHYALIIVLLYICFCYLMAFKLKYSRTLLFNSHGFGWIIAVIIAQALVIINKNVEWGLLKYFCLDKSGDIL